jgi:UDP-N-acetylmuramoylalanine--D-glutamate ligase
MKRIELLKHRVVILGYGREGLATHQALRRAGQISHVSAWVESGRGGDDIPTIVAPFDERLNDFDIAIRSPGIRVDHPSLQAYRDQGGLVINSSSIWFAEEPQVPVIGITGSKGKSTTTALVHHALTALGHEATMAGNVGRPLVSLLDEHRGPEAYVVAELSSYQLCDLVGQLRLGIITRLFPEHVDWHGSVENYYAAKLQIFDRANPNPVLINSRDAILMAQTQAFKQAVPINAVGCDAEPRLFREAHQLMWGNDTVLSLDQLALRGAHNLDNLVMACEVLRSLGLVEDGAWSEVLPMFKDFKPLAHRLDPVLESSGEVWINDSIATTPHATLAALQSLMGQPVILMVGGFERGADWSVVIDHLKQHPVKGVVTLPDTGAIIGKRLIESGVVVEDGVCHARSMSEAVACAKKQMQTLRGSPEEQWVVLLSPGAPSFGHYADFEDRGRAFAKAVTSCLGGSSGY